VQQKIRQKSPESNKDPTKTRRKKMEHEERRGTAEDREKEARRKAKAAKMKTGANSRKGTQRDTRLSKHYPGILPAPHRAANTPELA
jgi:hypothetical protein